MGGEKKEAKKTAGEIETQWLKEVSILNTAIDNSA